MKRFRLLLVAGILLIAGFFWLQRRGPENARSSDSGIAEIKPARLSADVPRPVKSQDDHGGQHGPDITADPPTVQTAPVDQSAKFLAAFQTPIEFYGKVVDQNNHPVADATVRMGAVDNPSERSASYEKKTDQEGLFSITGIRGAALSVFVSKDGYYVTNSHGPFRYTSRAVHDPPLPTKSTPVVFILFKKSEAEPLLHSESCVTLPADGSPVHMSLRRSVWRKAPVPPWDIQLQYLRGDQNNEAHSTYEWRLRVSVPNGGLITRSNRFALTAPLDGYQESDEIYMTADSARWRPTATREYFVKLASGEYGRFSIRINTGNENYVLVESFVNPSGSHNLERDPQKEIRAPAH